MGKLNHLQANTLRVTLRAANTTCITVRLAGVEVDEVAAPPAVTAVVRRAARSIMQVPTARRDAGGQRQRARRALPSV